MGTTRAARWGLSGVVLVALLLAGCGQQSSPSDTQDEGTDQTTQYEPQTTEPTTEIGGEAAGESAPESPQEAVSGSGDRAPKTVIRKGRRVVQIDAPEETEAPSDAGDAGEEGPDGNLDAPQGR